MPLVEYPASLPGPEAGSLSPRPRRAAPGLEGPLEQRARQRDFAGALSQYPFIYSPADMAVWREWYRTTLLDGRRWFSIPLPGAGGVVERVVKYREVQEHKLGAGNYRVDATLEQRGRSVPPRTTSYVYFDDFNGPEGQAIALHAPEIAPDGFAYVADAGVPILNGAGELAAGSGFDASALAEGLSFALTRPFSLAIVATPFATTFSEAAMLRIWGGLGNATVQIRTESGGAYSAFFSSGGSTHTQATTLGEHLARLQFNADDTATAYLDEVAVQTFACVPPDNPIDAIEVYVAGEAGVSCRINRAFIRIED